jgi:putative ABC transport system permease protein
MGVPLAWLNLIHERNRLMVAIAGVAFAVILIFMNLGFLGALVNTASLAYSNLNAEVFLASPLSLEVTIARPFPRERLYQAAGFEGVERVMPLYTGLRQWRNPETKRSRAIFIYAFNPNDPVFLLPELQQPGALELLRRLNTVFMDRFSRPEFGPQKSGLTTELDHRTVEVAGFYKLGGGFSAEGTLIMSDQNFRRYFPGHSLEFIELGLVKLQPGADPKAVATAIQQILPDDVRVFTREGIIQRDRNYWIVTTSTGFIFMLGVAIALAVGIVIVYQILYTDITEHLKQYATLKAIGYPNCYLFGVVLQEALILSLLGYIPGFAISLGLYSLTYEATNQTLPIFMESNRALLVFILTLTMCAVSGLVAIQKVTTADPAEVF